MFRKQDCGPKKSKKSPNAYSKDELIDLAVRELGYSKSAAKRLPKSELCKSLEKKTKKVSRKPKRSKKVSKSSNRKVSRKSSSKKSSKKTSRKVYRKSSSKKTSKKITRKVSRKTSSKKSSKKITRKVKKGKREKRGDEDDEEIDDESDKMASWLSDPDKKEKFINDLSKLTKSQLRKPEKRGKMSPCVERSVIPLKEHQRDVIDAISKGRGLVAVHAVGTGKTLTAVTATQCFLDENKKGKVVIVTPTSLQANFKETMEKYGINPDDKRYQFFTIQGFSRKGQKGEIDCKNTMLILDEAHNLRTEIKLAKSKKTGDIKQEGIAALQLVECAKKAKKVLLLTATPVVNTPYDTANLIAMIDGKGPISKREFTKMMNDPQKFKEYFSCRVSFYTPDPEETERFFPQKEVHEEFIQMSPQYYRKYLEIELNELEKAAKYGFDPDKDLKKFYNGVRRASNNLDEGDSPKVKRVMELINKSKKLDKFVIFSNFLAAGIKLIMQRLEEEGITFAHIDGSMSIKKRKEVVRDYNNNKIKVLLISRAGGEGLDLKGTRYLITLEPSWNDTTMRQVVGRAIRYKSHFDLPKERQKVDVYHLHLIKSFEKEYEKMLKEKLITDPKILSKELRVEYDEPLSVDFWMRNFSTKKQIRLNNFLDALSTLRIENLKC